MHKYLIIFLLPILLLHTACSTTLQEHRFNETDPRSAQIWTPTDLSREFSGNDPIEPFNRTMFVINDCGMHYLIRPLSWVYGSIFPVCVIDCLNNVSDNLAFPGRMISCFCQAKFKNGGISFLRFLLNSTVGLVGLFDVSKMWFNLPFQNENMGKAFAKWGIGPGCVLILPACTAVNVRDQIGLMFDRLLDLKILMPYCSSWILRFNTAISAYDDYNALTETLADPYDLSKFGLAAFRYCEIRDYQHMPLPPDPYDLATPYKIDYSAIPKKNLVRISHWYHPQSAEIDTVRFTMFEIQKNRRLWWIKTSLWNRDFTSLAMKRSVKIVPEKPSFPYEVWEGKKKDSPMVILIPGIGGHYKAPQLRALGELLHDKGYAVLLISSMYNTTFMNTTDYYMPGHTKLDAIVLRDVLKKVIEDMKKSTKLKPKAIHVGGYSMGGLHTLFLADLERKDPQLGIDHFIALNPPVDLKFGLMRFDNYLNVMKNFNRKDFLRTGADGLVKYTYTIRQTFGRVSKKQPADRKYLMMLSQKQAAMFAGLSFRFTLRDMLLAAHQAHPERKYFKTKYSWGRRSQLYAEIDKVSGMDYANDFLLPKYREKHPNATMDDLNKEAGLYAIEDTLRKHPKIHVIHNVDDPLLSEDNKTFLNKNLGDKITWFDCGGHLGNLFVKEHNDTFHSSFPEIPEAK